MDDKKRAALEFKKKVLELNDSIKRQNNHKLIQPTAPPTIVTVYKLHSNGAMTSEAGGWVYGNRIPKDLEAPITGAPFDGVKFPTENFAIMTLADAKKARVIMEYLAELKTRM
jgi:hypothetical protein